MAVRRDAKARRSGYPFDLREDGPAGPVVVRWDPEAFEWYGKEDMIDCGPREPFIRITQKMGIRISQTAAQAMGIEAGDRVAIGVNKAFLAFRKDKCGLAVRMEKGGSVGAVYLQSARLSRLLAAQGWPLRQRLPVVYDPDSGMLVARKPKAEGGEAVGTGNSGRGHASAGCGAGSAAGAGDGDETG